MSVNTGVEWADHSFSTWEGCSPKSRACRFCYARRDSKRWNSEDLWLRKGPRKFRKDDYWRKPIGWNRAAQRAGVPARVFCSPMADVFETHDVPSINTQLDGERARLWRLIDETPWLTWMLLTKRPEDVLAMVPWSGGWPANVWIGASVELQRFAAERIPILRGIPAAKRFLSIEPLVGPVDLSPWLDTPLVCGCGSNPIPGNDVFGCSAACMQRQPSGIDWVIVGGESGPKADPMHPEWARAVRDQCVPAGVPLFFKQWGQWGPDLPDSWSTRPVTWCADRTVLLDPDGTRLTAADPDVADPRVVPLYRVGKKHSGRLLDGRIWDEVPDAVPA